MQLKLSGWPHRMPPPLRALLICPAGQLLADYCPPAILSVSCLEQLASLLPFITHAAARVEPLCQAALTLQVLDKSRACLMDVHVSMLRGV